MRHHPNFTVQIERRIFRFEQTAKVETQCLRNKWITELDDLFDIATSIAKGKTSQQQMGDKLHSITPKERQMWAQVAANIGSVMCNLSKGYDDTRFNEDIAELERQIGEIKKIQAEYAQKQDPSAETKSLNAMESAGNS